MKKFYSLFATAIALGISVNAFALDWDQVVPEKVQMYPGLEGYIVNEATARPFVGRQTLYNWSTTAGLADNFTEGQLCIFVGVDQDVYPNYYYITNSNGNLHTFRGNDNLHVDMANQGHDIFVFKAVNDDNVYTIHNPAEDILYGDVADTQRWGVKNANEVHIYPNITEEDDVEEGLRQWYITPTMEPLYKLQLYKLAEMVNADCPEIDLSKEKDLYDNPDATAAELKEVYDLLLPKYKLKKLMNAVLADCPEVSLDEATEVYENPDATAKNYTDAYTKLEAAYKEAMKTKVDWGSASVDAPIDLTEKFVVNPNFDGIKFDGWLGSGFGAGGSVDECAERYNMDFDTYQKISGLHEGVYLFSCQGLYRPGAGDAAIENALANGDVAKQVRIYAQAGEENREFNTPVHHYLDGIEPGDDSMGGAKITVNGESYYVPDSMKDAVRFFKGGKYGNNVVAFFLKEGEDVQLGVKKVGATIGADWGLFDTFKLKYIGNTADAYQVIMNNYISALPVHSGDEELVTYALAEDYENAKEIPQYVAVTNDADLMDKIAWWEAKLDEINENLAAWKSLDEAVTVARGVLGDEFIDKEAQAVEALANVVNTANNEMYELRLGTEEVKALVAQLDTMRIEAMKCFGDGSDFTNYIKNAGMDSAEGWNGNPTINAKCGEKYGVNGDFDVYQEVEGVPAGLYEIKVQGFFRQYRDDTGGDLYKAWKNAHDANGNLREDLEVLSFVYMNDSKTPMESVYKYPHEITLDADNKEVCEFFGAGTGYGTDETHSVAYPNNMVTAATSFAAGEYSSIAYGLVAKEGDKMRIGVKGHLGGSDWAIFDNFKLTYRAKNPEIIVKLLEDLLPSINTDVIAGSDVIADALQTINDAQYAESNDEKFDALAKCYSINTKLEASAKNFENLADKLIALSTAIGDADGICSEETVENAITLYSEIEAGAGNAGENIAASYTDAQAIEAIAAIDDMIEKLAIPNFDAASDDNPLDVTKAFLKDADFEGLKVTTESNNKNKGTFGAWNFEKAGGNGPALGTTACEFWMENPSQMQFNLNQMLQNPNAELPAGTYVLTVKAGNSFNTLAPNEDATGGAFLYAEVEGDDVFHCTNIIPQEDAATVFAEYEVVFRVTEPGQKVKVGVKNVGTMPARWIVMDDFALQFYGPDSERELSGDATASEVVVKDLAKSKKVAGIYTINGAKVNALQKGINIVVLEDGTVLKAIKK